MSRTVEHATDSQDAHRVSRRTLLSGAAAGAAGVALGTAVGQGTASAAPNGALSVHRRATFQRDYREFFADQVAVYDRHWAQTPADVEALRAKYTTPVFGAVDPRDVLDDLGRCIDPTDRRLGAVSQHVHIQQILAGMERDGIVDEDMYFLAVVHDLGKILLLTDEDPANVVCGNRPIGTYEPGVGLDNVVFQWNHDEFMYDRLRGLVPDHIAWVVRYHSIRIHESEPYMDERDREYLERWLRPFQAYDTGTKSTYGHDARTVERWKPLLVDRLGPTITI